MKQLKNYLFIPLILLLVSCEEIDVVELDIDYTEKIVVQSELIAGEFFEGVYLSKTLPLNERYSPEVAEITDAALFLILDSVKVIPLHYRGLGKYESFNPFKVVSNQTFELFGEVGKTKLYAKTIIPNMPLYSNSRFVPEGYLSTSVKLNSGEAYGAIWLMANNVLSKPFDQSKDFFSILTKLDPDDEEMLVRTTLLNNEYFSSYYSDKIFIQIYSFDQSYYKYFKTKNNNSPIEDNFSQGGGPIDWNVEGHNVIGMFIGVAKTGFIQIVP
jgi:hypothetical protein